ncbi:MAG: flagellar hook-basal body complex protein FliE [Clostridiales bacterium]|nr:flagellar hook-basal body complex protein FliE [Clostridiales bacterium]
MGGISKISGVDALTAYKNNITNVVSKDDNTVAFDSLLDSAVQMLDETNRLSNLAQEEEIKYALGQSTSTHDLIVAQQKANLSLQYTVVMRDSVVSAYRELMNMQF